MSRAAMKDMYMTQEKPLIEGGRLRLAMAAAGVFAAAVLGGCAGSGGVASPLPLGHSAERPVEFPAPESAKWTQGSYPNVADLRIVRTGIGRDHVRELIGVPHFDAGMFGTRDWDYLFHFHAGKGGQVLTCQYKVRFNEERRVSGNYWKTTECAAFVNPPPVAALPAPKVQAQAPHKLALEADTLFRFNGATAADLLPEGRARIAQLAVDIRRHFRSIDGILVVGHTDRLGGDEHNNALSLARARTVRELLVEGGIDPKLVRSRGDGKRVPVAECPEALISEALVRCLQPNRRVEVEISGTS
jgi:OOP family OmpA-OmpF porin